MQVTTIGLDLAKHVFQIHGIDAAEKVVVRRQLRRSQVMAFFEALSPCLIGMEACTTAQYWARELVKLGHEVRLMPAKDVQLMTVEGRPPERARFRWADITRPIERCPSRSRSGRPASRGHKGIKRPSLSLPLR